MLLEQNQPQPALELLTAPQDQGMYGLVFHQWTAALAAEAAVLAHTGQAEELLRSAIGISVDNPVATAITHRAAALLAGDAEMLLAAGEEFHRAGTSYQYGRNSRPRPSLQRWQQMNHPLDKGGSGDGYRRRPPHI